MPTVCSLATPFTSQGVAHATFDSVTPVNAAHLEKVQKRSPKMSKGLEFLGQEARLKYVGI